MIVTPEGWYRLWWAGWSVIMTGVWWALAWWLMPRILARGIALWKARD